MQPVDDVEIARAVVAGGDGVLKFFADEYELIERIFLKRRQSRPFGAG